MRVKLVIFDGGTKIDLTQDTVTAASLKKGRTAHNAAGDIITGTLEEGAMDVDKKNNTAGGQTVTISGRETAGIDISDVTASATNIESGKTAYVNGSKITGTLSFRNLYTSTPEPSSSDGTPGDIWIVTAS